MDYRNELEKIKRTANCNKDINISTSSIILYGAGALGEMAMDILSAINITPIHVVDKSKRGKLRGIQIEALDELSKKVKKNELFLITVCTVPYNDIEMELRSVGIEHIISFYTYAYLICPDIISNGWFIENITLEIEQEILQVCRLLEHDEYSVQHYLQFCWWKLRGKEVLYKDYPILKGKKYFNAPCMPELGKQEFLIDCGCHKGGTIKMFIDKTNGCFEKVLAFEPDLRNLMCAKQSVNDIRVIFDEHAISVNTGQRAFLSNLGFASKIVESGNENIGTLAIDDLKVSPSIIKIHVEGEEYNVMRGALSTIKESRPILMVFADHNEDGLFKIPAFVQNLEGYILYFYLHDYCGNSAVFYMIPIERIRKYESKI